MLILITFSSIIAGILNIMTLNFLETLVAGNISFDLINIINISIATFTLTILNSLWIYKGILKFNVLKHIR